MSQSLLSAATQFDCRAAMTLRKFSSEVCLARTESLEALEQSGPTDHDDLNRLIGALACAPAFFATTYFDSKVDIIHRYYETLELDSDKIRYGK